MRFVLENARWLGAGALLAFCSSFGQTFFISIFANDIRGAFSLTHGEWGLIYGVGTGLSALAMVWAGALSDHFRVRSLALYTLIGLGISALLMAVTPFAGLLFVTIFALRLTGQGMLSHISRVAMARWFVASRGKALAIATLGFAVGEAFLPMLFVALKPLLGWRLLWVCAAAVALLSLPILLSLLKEERTPQSFAKETEATGMQGRHWTRQETVSHPLFWLLMPTLFGLAALITALFFHQIHLAEVKGWTHAELTRVFPIYTGVGIAAMLMTGIVIDRVGSGVFIAGFQLPIALGFWILMHSDSLTLGSLGFACIGLTQGIAATLIGAFWAEYYGTRHIGAIKALATAIMVLGTAVGPWVTGYAIDLGVNISQQFIWFGVYFLGSFVLAALGLRLARPS